MVTPDQTLLLSQADVRAVLDLETCIQAVEEAFHAHGEGRAQRPGVLGLQAPDGGFHVKAGLIEVDGQRYFAAKTNANFMHNRERHGAPTIQGVVLLCDGETGRPLALMDSIEITIVRTGAATAVAARHLARADAGIVTIAGCGAQGRVQLRAVAAVRPVHEAFVFDRDREAAAALAGEVGSDLGIEIHVVDDFAEAIRQSGIVVTCTPSRHAIVRAADVLPGTFVGGVGADNEDKQELDPELLRKATVVVDVLEQAATIGDLHHALKAGTMTTEDVHAEVGAVVAGRKPGRRTADEITVFDSTGMALLDAAAAVVVYQRAVAAGRGQPFAFRG